MRFFVSLAILALLALVGAAAAGAPSVYKQMPRGSMAIPNKHVAATFNGSLTWDKHLSHAQIESTLFAGFKQRFHRQYMTASEEAFRFQIFRQSLKRIDAKNARAATDVYGITKFSDMTPEEWKSQYLGLNLDHTKHAANAAAAAAVTTAPQPQAATPLPASFDWRDKNAVTEVKDQGQCGSCWAFSAAETLESAWILSGHSMVDLSPQQIVDCDNRPGDQGCNGGDPTSAFQYIISTGGLDTDESYPYYSGDSGAADSCTFNKSNIAATLSQWAYAVAPCNDSCTVGRNESKLLESLITHGPVSICQDASNWQDYTWGVFSDCSSDAASLDHAVQLVGYYGETAGSPEFYLVRNSWNEDWGDDGYIQIAYGYNTCGITDLASVVVSTQ